VFGIDLGRTTNGDVHDPLKRPEQTVSPGGIGDIQCLRLAVSGGAFAAAPAAQVVSGVFRRREYAQTKGAAVKRRYMTLVVQP
jgi:hypothetical protein